MLQREKQPAGTVRPIMRRLWIVLALALALASTGAAPLAAAEDEAKPGCDEPKLASTLLDTQVRTRDVSPLRAVAPAPLAPCRGVRPGAEIHIPKVDSEGTESTGLCTLNFMFIGTDAKRNKHVYMGTAGHCLLAETNIDREKGEHHWAPGKGPVVEDADGNRIGEFAYAILSGPKDIGLIRIDYGVKVSSQMCWFGGPTGINNDITTKSVNIHHYGHGLAVGDTLPARTSVAYGMRDKDEVTAVGVVIPGDSGGAAISSDGRAIGVVVSIGASFSASPLGGGTVGITRLKPQIERAEKVLKQRIRMVTAPLI